VGHAEADDVGDVAKVNMSTKVTSDLRKRGEDGVRDMNLTAISTER
jgi:hypothetical protein